MNAPLMNKMQLCCAGAGRLEGAPKPQRGAPAAKRRGGLPQAAAMRAATLVLAAASLAGAAAVWLAVSREEPALAIVELPRVVITATRLPAGACPVPVEPADADCPVPLPSDATSTALDISPESSLSRGTP